MVSVVLGRRVGTARQPVSTVPHQKPYRLTPATQTPFLAYLLQMGKVLIGEPEPEVSIKLLLHYFLLLSNSQPR